MRTRATITLAAALALAVTGCSSGDDSDDAAPATSAASSPAAEETTASDPAAEDRAALEQAVKDYTAALFSGDATGYDALSARCKKTMTKASWVGMAKGARQQYGEQQATNVRVSTFSKRRVKS